jgi:molecular chaperone GrpE (heat shock protein)
MKKIRVTESEDETATSTSSAETSAVASSEVDRSEGDDPMAGLQADLDRFRDLALRSQADFENYK